MSSIKPILGTKKAVDCCSMLLNPMLKCLKAFVENTGTNWADIYIDVRTILKIQMEICQTVTIRSFSLVFLSGTILNKESCSKTHTTQGHSRIRILTLSSIKRLSLKTLKDPLTEHV